MTTTMMQMTMKMTMPTMTTMTITAIAISKKGTEMISLKVDFQMEAQSTLPERLT